ncbi:MAG TPA: hypothetical protein VHG28_12775, partial [Longimicrobiaceae bacterium]|nr:hypothetical protein [Longimicrobiaceae bacterium]
FDRGFSTAAPVEEAVARLVDTQGPVFVEPETCAHPLLERRTAWREREPRDAAESVAPSGSRDSFLTLQLLPEPRRVAVRPRLRRGHVVPARYLDLSGGRSWRNLAAVAGPDRVSGGRWEGGYAREYFRCVTETGTLVWLYRDAAEDAWYLHGWWD